MSEIPKIESLLTNLAGVYQVHYQIWNSKGSLIFSTENLSDNHPGRSTILKFAKKIIVSGSFLYRRLKSHGYICGVPIRQDQQAPGALLAYCLKQGAEAPNARPEQMESLLNQIATFGVFENADDTKPEQIVVEHTGHGFEDLYLFANLSKQFRSLRLKQPVLNKLMHRIVTSMQADAAFLQLPKHPQYNQLQIRADLLKQSANSSRLRKAFQALVGTCTQQISENYCLINDSRANPEFAALSDKPYRLLAVSLRHLKVSYGWLGLVSYCMDRQFNSRELDIFQTLANQISAMIANMDHHEDLERFTVNMVCSLVCAIEAKDAYTDGHSRRVHQYAMNMARRLDMPVEEIESLKWAAILHDIGKIGIPERVLNKPGKLTADEYALIKQHPLKGKSILEPIRQLGPSLNAVVYHHERFNGKGYPEGLKGEQIPLAARIIAVADTFDAITSKRSYHRPKAPQEAMLVLDQVAGTQLDPHLVRIFKAAYRQSTNQDIEPLRAVNA